MMIPNVHRVDIKIPDDSISEFEIKQLPKNWHDYPAPTILSELAEEWIRSMESVALKVPSSIVSTASNFILNCQHSQFSKVKILQNEPFDFDPRLTRSL
jgi:RES domain-containing protein